MTGLPGAVNKHDLLDLFAACGALDAEIQKNSKGSSRGFGYVLLPSVDLMRTAVDTKNDTMFRGKPIEVEISRRRRGGYGFGAQSPHNSPHKSPHSGPNSPNYHGGGGRRQQPQPPLLIPMELGPSHHHHTHNKPDCQ